MTNRATAKWDTSLHVLFVELCKTEVQKGNRPNTTLSKDGWANVDKAFNEKTKLGYTRKQLKNHWDSMKADWTLFKKLRRGHTGLGWNEAKKSIDAPEEWWDARCEENDKYKKFRNTDLSMYWFSYDTLFGDIVATGERARAPNQQSATGLEFAAEEEFVPTPPGDARKEGSGDSDEELRDVNRLFPQSYTTGQKEGSSGSKRKKSGAEMIRDCLENVTKALVGKSQSTTTTAATSNDYPDALDILDSMTEIAFMSPQYHYAQQFLKVKENRIIWFKARSNEQRASTIAYNYDQHVRKGGS